MKKFSRPQRTSGQSIPTSGTARPQVITRLMPTEFLTELQSAASMIMSREECIALERELRELRSPRSAAA